MSACAPRLCGDGGETVSQTPFEQALVLTSLHPNLQKYILYRYVPLIKKLRRKARLLGIAFHSSRIIITVGSLIVPALLSIQYTDSSITAGAAASPTEQSLRIYWTTWFISLLVTISNGFIALFKLDRRYYLAHTTLEHLTTEGWQFIQLTAKYSGLLTPHLKTITHENQFIHFSQAIEKIHMRRVEEEFYKLSELQQAQPAATGTSAMPASEQTVAAPRVIAQPSTGPGAAAGAAPAAGTGLPLQRDTRRDTSQVPQQRVSNPSSENAAQPNAATGAATAPSQDGPTGAVPV